MVVITADTVHAQIPTFELHDYEFRCQFAKEARDSLKGIPSEEIVKALDESIHTTTEALEEESLEKEERKVLKTHLRLLEELRSDQAPQGKLDTFYQNLCTGSESALKGASKIIFHAANAYQQSVTLPFRYLIRFFKGVISGKKNDFSRLSWNNALGPKTSRGISYYLLYRGFQAISSGQPALAPLYISAMTDTITAKFCDLRDVLSAADRTFCDRYQKFKDEFYQMASVGQSQGAKLRSGAKKPKSNWNSPITDENYCEWLSSERKNLDSNEVTAALRETVLGTLNPGALSHPKISKLKTEETNLVSASTVSISKLRNVIISLSPPEETVQKMIDSGSFDRFKALQAEVQNLMGQDEQLFRMNTIESCQKKKEKIGFRYQTMLQKQAELAKYKNEAFYSQHQLIEAQFKKAKTRLNWELVSSVSLNALHDLLRSPNVANIIIVTHSLENNRKMIDSSLNQFPTTFFGEFSPSILSISFFTCNSENYLTTYDLSARLSRAASIHPERFLSLVDQGGVLGNSNRAPMNGFIDYLGRVDRVAERALQNTLLSQAFVPSDRKIAKKTCSLEVPETRVLQGSLALILNRQFIGSINATEPNTRLEFDCALLKEKNTLKIQGVSMVESLRLESVPEVLRLNDQIVSGAQREDFTDSEDHYSMSLFEFNVSSMTH